MSTLMMIFRKMFNNRWIVLSLFVGLLITVALVSSIPSYTNGVLQRLLVSELQDIQLQQEDYPGKLYQFVSFADKDDVELEEERLNEIERYFHNNLTNYVDIPTVADVTNLTSIRLNISYRDQDRYDDSNLRSYFTLGSMTGLEDHIELVDGRLPETEPVDGVYEALVTDLAFDNLSAVLETEFVLSTTVEDPETEEVEEQEIIVKPVGIFTAKDERDPYWFASINIHAETFMIPDAAFRETFVEGDKKWLSNAKLYSAYDYNEITLPDIDRLIRADARLDRFTRNLLDHDNFSIDYPIRPTLFEYRDQEAQLTTMLWSLNVPVLIMLALYLFMVSKLIVDRQQTEIAVLRSRGAGRFQLLLIYFIEACILGGIALLAGPYIGLFMSQILGASSGFLEFVNRTALPVSLDSDVYLYALYTVIGCIVMIMIPVFLATRQSIVSQKRDSSRVAKSALWQRFFLDIALLLVAWYGWSTYQRQQQQLMGQVDIGTISVDPLLFFIPAVFVIGFGLFCLRIYPWVVRLIYWIGRRWWTPSMYTTLIQVGRSSKQYQFLMLFLIMTIAIGIYSASSARTINTNLEEQILYEHGADIDLQVRWESNAPSTPTMGGPMGGAPGEDNDDDDIEDGPTRIQYSEPPFQPMTELPGVEHAAKVFTRDGVTVEGNANRTGGVELMGIETNQFGEVAWFKSDLLHPNYHWYEYLNLIAGDPRAAIISSSLARDLDVREGDTVTVGWDQNAPVPFYVYAIVDYWPTWQPVQEDNDNPKLIVTNLHYVQTQIGLEPYNVWLRLGDNASTAELYAALEEEGIRLTDFRDANQELIQLRQGAFLLGLNGSLTLGFLIAMVVTFCGFLIYWILTFRSRILQYGVFRAMGLSLRQLIGMVTWEQILTSGAACLLGVLAGTLTSQLFVPLFELTLQGSTQVPPFEVIFDRNDELRLYTFVGAMLFIGLVVLGWLLSRIRIHQAVKLGED